ncbi:MAG TPA: DsrE family protein [Magnetospirillaceae bacterium]|nr:DsrE family protein [Magnetospirillaceae bacterium]
MSFATRLRALICALFLIGGSAQGADAIPAGYYQDQKVVYHNDGGAPDNAAYFRRLLNSLRNHLDAVGQEHVEIRVVDHAAGVDLFVLARSDKELAAQIDTLKSRGVRFLICNNTLRERGLDWHQLYGVAEADIVPSGVAELARLQGLGYVYIHL